MKITAETLRRITVPAGSERTFWDDDVRGFGVRVRSSGARSFIFWYRLRASGKQCKLTLPLAVEPKNVRTAREKAADMWAAVRQGSDPQAAKIEDRKSALVTFGAKVDEYLEWKASTPSKKTREVARPRTIAEARYYLTNHFKPLHSRRLDFFESKEGRSEVANVLTKIRQRGAITERQAFAHLSAFFVWALRTNHAIETNPLLSFDRPAPAKCRSRILADDELAAVWNACEDDDYGRIIRLLILTLQRESEIGSAQWGEVDEAESLLLLPGSRTKNHRDHAVPLVPLALDLILQSPKRPDDERPDGTRPTIFGRAARGFNGWSKAKGELDQRIAVARAKDGKPQPLAHWVLHDLRRTGRTGLSRLGIANEVKEAVVNHVSTADSGKAGVSGTYDHHDYLDEKRAALALWADHVQALASGRAGKVVRLRRA
jgi:integrase